ncbi:hypothetical protein B0H14DRAFT_2904611 [Mycena olivaceomarginata]|nr:hypothetical protein B0H14DRAFT_2904611 [Mycena olivaceomarginata]
MKITALNVQELCDLIAGFLQESKWDLRACSLLSPSFTSAAQRYLFADIIFNRGTLDIDDVSRLERYDEAKACARLCAVLRSSPHLIPFIRRMRASLEPGVLTPLSKVDFPNLYDIVFHRRTGGAASAETIALAARLIGSLSIRRVGLLSPAFNGMQDFIRLFAQHTPALDSIFLDKVLLDETGTQEANVTLPPPSSRVRVKTLRWDWNHEFPTLLLNSALPLDLSSVVDLDFSGELSTDVWRLVQPNRESLRRLAVDAQLVVEGNEYRAADPHPALLADLAALTHLTLMTPAHHLADAATLLGHLPRENNLRSLTLEIKKVRQLKEGRVRVLGAACAGLHEACTVTVRIRRFASGTDGIDGESLVRAAFAEVDGRGRLSVIY